MVTGPTIAPTSLNEPIGAKFWSTYPAIGALDDSNFAAETLANGRHDLLECFNRALATIPLAISQLGKERNVTAKAVNMGGQAMIWSRMPPYTIARTCSLA
jgi:hypothetical protein